MAFRCLSSESIAYFISATASKGIGRIPWFVPAVLSLQYYFYTLVHIWHLQKNAVSIVVVNVIPPIAASTTLFTSSMLRPYLPIASDLLQYRYTSHQLLARHTNLSLFGPFQRLLIFLCQSFDGI
jgi:hypothetical protein